MTIKASDVSTEHHGILLRLIELSNREASCGLSVAVTSPKHSNGVTYVTSMLCAGLRLMSVPDVMNVQLSVLEKAQNAAEVFALAKQLYPKLDAERDFQTDPTTLSSPWNYSVESRRRLVRELCGGSRIVLIDCPPLRQSNRTMIAAGVVDSVILVVEAGVTTKEDISSAERKIQASGGNLEGYILNKVRNQPRWFNWDR